MENTITPELTTTAPAQGIDFAAALARIRAAGYGGFSIWSYTKRAGGVSWMACLNDRQGERLEDTNLWEYTDSETEALKQITEKAERLAARAR